MLSTSCPHCRSSFTYLPEQAGSTANCGRCFNEIDLKTQPWRDVWLIGSGVVSLMVLAGLFVFGAAGAMTVVGVYGLFGGGAIVGAAVLAVVFGMPVRTVAMIFAFIFIAIIGLIGFLYALPYLMPYIQAMQQSQ